ncbi:MAG: M48 family metallopeptidase, partial [Candidatus Hydrogenedens sp.]
MFELIRQNKRRSILLAILMLIFMLLIGYVIGSFLAFVFYYFSEPYAFANDRIINNPTQQYAPYSSPNHYSPRLSEENHLTYEQVQYFIWLYWGPLGALVAFVIWFIQMLFAYYSGGNMLLSISNAVKIEKVDHPQLYNIVEEMKIASRLPAMPEIYVIDDPSINAFATGRSPEHSAVAVTRGLLNTMNRDQIQGVIAHEISHITHRDTLYMTMLAVSLGTIILLVVGLREIVGAGIHGSARYSGRNRKETSGIILFLILVYIFALLLSLIAPFLAQIIYFACSRQREYLADAGAVVFTRNPEGLASALETIAKRYQKQPATDVNQIIAPLYIVNPLETRNLDASSIFSTHPPLQRRIQILRNIARSPFLTYEQAWQEVEGKKWTKGAITPPANPLSSATTTMSQVSTTPLQNARLSGDAIMKAQKYTFLNCKCGVTLKVP